MSQASIRRDDLVWAAALTLPLLARLHAEGLDAALQRLLLLGAVAIVVHAWAWLFARTAQRPLGSGLPAFALGFVLLLPGPVGWGGALLAVSFGAVFGREIFGGRALLPPALIALVFAVYSFPDGGFEARQVLTLTPDPVFTLACLAGAALVLVLRCTLAVRGRPVAKRGCASWFTKKLSMPPPWRCFLLRSPPSGAGSWPAAGAGRRCA